MLFPRHIIFYSLAKVKMNTNFQEGGFLYTVCSVFPEEGDVYVWGGGGEGQLGLGQETEEMKKPVKLELGVKAVCISCGYYHTAIVTG